MQNEIQDIKTAMITSKGQICIPHIARNLVGFKEGTKISIVVYSDRIELKPMNNLKVTRKKNINDALFCMLASEEVLAEAWDTPEEDEAWKNL